MLVHSYFSPNFAASVNFDSSSNCLASLCPHQTVHSTLSLIRNRLRANNIYRFLQKFLSLRFSIAARTRELLVFRSSFAYFRLSLSLSQLTTASTPYIVSFNHLKASPASKVVNRFAYPVSLTSLASTCLISITSTPPHNKYTNLPRWLINSIWPVFP